MPISRAFKLYAVTADKFVRSPEYFLPRLKVACEAGITAFQLRLKDAPAGDFLEIAKGCKAICVYHKVPFYIDDNVDLVRTIGADGLHVGQDDTPLSELMALQPPLQCRVGSSVYNDLSRLRQAIACPLVDYVGVSIYSTPTKPEAKREKGPPALAEMRTLCTELGSEMPLVAIGGLDVSHVRECVAAGADGIAVVRAIWEAETLSGLRARVAAFRQELDRYL